MVKNIKDVRDEALNACRTMQRVAQSLGTHVQAHRNLYATAEQTSYQVNRIYNSWTTTDRSLVETAHHLAAIEILTTAITDGIERIREQLAA